MKLQIEILNNCDFIDFTFDIDFFYKELTHMRDGLTYTTIDFDNRWYEIDFAWDADGQSIEITDEHEELINEWIDNNHNELNEQIS